MSAIWYYTKQGQQQGPVMEAQLKELVGSGQVLPTDHVWTTGMPNWVAASSVEVLFPKPPPLPPTAPQSNEAEKALVESHKLRAQELFDADKYQEAIAEYTEAVRLDPSCPELYVGRGDAHFQNDDYQAAVRDFDAAIRVDPRCQAAYRERGTAYYMLDDYSKALTDFTTAIRLDPNDYWSFIRRGRCYRTQKQAALAEADFSRAIQIDNAKAIGHYERGRTRWLRDDNGAAIQDFNQALCCDEDYVLARYFRGCAYLDDGNPSKAVADLERFLETNESEEFEELRQEAQQKIEKAREMLEQDEEEEQGDEPEDSVSTAAGQQVDLYGPQVETRIARMRSLAKQYETCISGGYIDILATGGAGVNTRLLRAQQIEQEFFRLKMELEAMGVTFNVPPGKVFYPTG